MAGVQGRFCRGIDHRLLTIVPSGMRRKNANQDSFSQDQPVPLVSTQRKSPSQNEEQPKESPRAPSIGWGADY
jgi:hypothetical protein